MNEESQVGGCCNITFICTPTRKQCRLSPESDAYRQQLELLLTDDLLLQGHWGEEDAAGPAHQVLTL